jgi:O-Antigen ligase
MVEGSRAVASGRIPFRIGRVIQAAGQLVSFEAAFLLFIFAAAYKADPRFAWFPGDMTLVFFGVSVAAAVVPLLRASLFYLPGIKVVWAGGIFVLWIAASLAWSPSEIYVPRQAHPGRRGKPVVPDRDRHDHRQQPRPGLRFFILLLVFGVAMGVDYAISSSDAPERGRLDDFLRIGENYLALGRLVGMAAMVAFALWLRSPPRSARGVALIAAIALCGYALLKAGGRNPVAAAAIPMLMPLLLSFRLSRGQLVISRSILAALGFVAVVTLGVISLVVSGDSSLRTLHRFDTLMSEDSGGRSAASRFEHWGRAVAYWAERPLVGHGVGAWPILYWGRDYRHYPHNMILELLVEVGLVGLVLFAALVLVGARRVSLQRLREDPALMCALMLCMNTFVNAMSTGDLADNRNLFAMLGLLAMRPPKGPIDAGTQGRPPDVGASALRHTDLSQAVPHLGRLRIRGRARDAGGS